MQISDNPLQLALADSGLVCHGPTALPLSFFGSHGGGHRVTSSLLNRRIRNGQERMVETNGFYMVNTYRHVWHILHI